MKDELYMSKTHKRILFVCTGNTCRSPMAEVLAKTLAENGGFRRIEVRSAGTSAAPGHSASEGALRAAHRHGLALRDHVSTPLSPELIAWADLVLAMGPAHLARIRELGGTGKSALLGAFSEGEDGALEPAVPDPFGGDDETYEATFRTLEEMVTAALDRLSKEQRE